MTSRRIAWICFIAISLSLVTGVCDSKRLCAVEATNPPTGIHYRRVFVPADDLESQVKGLIPLKRTEFERRIADSAATQPSDLASHVRVQRAIYSARFDGNQFVDGKAQLVVINTVGIPTPLPWESTLAFGKPQWDEQPPRTARIGTTPAGATILLVEKSGTLTLPWSLRGSAKETNSASFDLVLPKAAVSRLVLQLPADLIIESDSGIISRLQPDAAESKVLPAGDLPVKNWLLELGGLHRSRLLVSNTAQKEQRSGVLLVRESATHVLSPADVSSEYSLQLDAHQTQLNTLKLELDAPARILGVRVGSTSLSWREFPTAEPKQTLLQIDLPESVVGSGTSLTVNTVVSLATDRPWRLPRLRLQNSTWQEGTATLVVPPTLQVGNMQLVDARQTSISAGSPSQPEQVFQFQYLSATGTVLVQPTREVPHLNILGGLVLRHEATQLSATLNLDLSVDSGERFLVEGITNENWIIDSVDTTPQDLLDERKFVPLEGRKFALSVRLNRPITSKEKKRLTIRAHRQLPTEGEGIAVPSLQLVEFQNTRDEAYVVALRVVDNSREFQLSGEMDLYRIDPESAAPEELSLLDSSAAGILFRLDRQAEGARVFLVPSDPRFTAAIETSAVALKDKVEHRASARIVPTSASLVRLYVRASGPIAAAMRWQLIGAGDLTIASQTLLPSQSPLVSGGQQESVWELVLNRPTNQPITLESLWESSPAKEQSLPLFSFPEAASQTGLMRVETGPGFLSRLETAGVKPIPAPLPPAGDYSAVRGIFRYEPGRQAAIHLIAASSDNVLPLAWANSCQLTSRFSPDGSATHEILWQLENHGMDRFPFSLPTGVRLLQVSLDGEDMPMPTLDSNTQQHYVPLPNSRRNPVISLIVSSSASKARALVSPRFTAPLITTPLKILDRKWIATLPSGIRPISNGAKGETSDLRNWHEIWRTRLIGILEPSREYNQEKSFKFPWNESQPLVIAAYSPGMVQIGGFTLAMTIASLVIWLAYRRLTLVFLLASCFACAAILLPLAWAPVAAGAFWGCLSGGSLCLVRPQFKVRQVAQRVSPSTRTLIATGATGLLLFVVLAVASRSPATAATDEPKGSIPIAIVHRVIIPVDDDQMPQGDYVYVSLDFYTLLFRSLEREQLPAWLLRSTTFEMEAAEDNASAIIVMRLEVETLAPRAQVSLPFRRGDIHLLEGRTALDGEPISLDWDDAGTALHFEVDRPGVYQLAIAFSAPSKEDVGTFSWRFNVPSAGRSILHIRSPGSPSDWQLPTVQGAITKPLDDGDLLAELGIAGKFEVIRKDPRRLVKNMTEAEQYVWWQIRPGSVTAEMLMRIRPVNGTIKEIKLLADPHLRLLPMEDESRISRVWTDEGDPRSIHLTLAEPTSEMVQFKRKFLLLDASGIGRFVVPQLEVSADQKTIQWQAISFGREREGRPDPQVPIISHPPVEFIDNFGGAARPPDLAFEATGQSPAFFVRPFEGVVHAKEFVDISFGRNDAEIYYRVDLSDIPSHRFQEMVDLPIGFRVKRVALLEQGNSVSFPLPTAQQNGLTIHRARAPGPSQQLELEGTLPLSALGDHSASVRIPEIRSAVSDGATIRIYRTLAALASIKSVTGVEPSITPEGAAWDPRLGYLQASYRSAPSAQPPPRSFVVESKPNIPTADHRLITRMERTAPRSWSAVVYCEVTPVSGSLDTVRLEVPAEWSGPFEFTPPMDHQVALLPGQTQRHLIIRPYDSSSGKISFSIRGPVKSQTGDALQVPVVTPLDTSRADSYLALPSRIVDEDLQWQTSGLQAITAGETAEANLKQAGHEIFRVVAPRFTATLLQLKSSRAKAGIEFTEMLVRPGHAGNDWTIANFYLLPGGRDEAKLKLPTGSQMVQVLVNGSPAEVRTQPDETSIVRLGHDQLPQLVKVIFFSHEPDVSGKTAQSAPPIWIGISAGKTIWSLLPRQDSQTHLGAATAEAEAQDSCEAPLERMAAIIRIMRDAGDTIASGLPPQQLRNWTTRWRLEFARADQAAVATTPRASVEGLASPDGALESRRRNLEVEFSTVLSRYPDNAMNPIPPKLDGRTEWPNSDREQVQVFQTLDSAPLSLTIPVARSSFNTRLGLAVFLLAISLAAAFFASAPRSRSFFDSSFPFVLAISAVAGLVFLPMPMITAPLLACAALWFSLRRNWPLAKFDTPSHLIHRSSISRPPLA